MLQLKNINVSFEKKQVIKSLSLDCNPGEVTTIVGLNGVGKTTLFNCILRKIDFSGSVSINNKPVESKDIGYFPQHPPTSIPMRISVLDVIARSFQVLRRDYFCNKVSRNLANILLEEMEIHHLKSMQMSHLSGGQMQLVRMTLALVHEPRLLLLDEPLSFLDEKRKLSFIDYICKITRQRKLITLMISHEIAISTNKSDCIFAMSPQGLKGIKVNSKMVCIESMSEALDLDKNNLMAYYNFPEVC